MPTIFELAIAAVDQRAQLHAGREQIRFGERLVDQHFVVARRIGPAPGAQQHIVDARLAIRRQRHEARRHGIGLAGEIEQADAGDARLERIDARQRGQIVRDGIRSTHDRDRDIRHSRRVVVAVARALERVVHARGHDEQRHAAREHRGDGNRLRLQPLQVAQQLAIERREAHHQCQLRRRNAPLVRFDRADVAVGEPHDAIADARDVRVVRDQQRRRAELVRSQ